MKHETTPQRLTHNPDRTPKFFALLSSHICLCFCLAIQAAEGAEKTPDTEAVAKKFLRCNRLERAQSLLEGSPATARSGQAQLMLGFACFVTAGEILESQGDFKQAERHYAKALTLYPYDSNTYLALSNCKLAELETKLPEPADSRIPDLSGEISLLKQAADLDGSNWRIWNNLGALQLISNQSWDSLNSLKAALTCKPPEWAKIGLDEAEKIQPSQRKLKRGLEELDSPRSRKLKASIEGLISAGKVAYSKGSYSRAEELFNDAINQCKDSSLLELRQSAHSQLIKTFVAQKKFNEAEISCRNQEKLLDINHDPDCVSALYCSIGAIKEAEGELAEATKCYAKARNIATISRCELVTIFDSSYALGRIYWLAKKYEEAIEILLELKAETLKPECDSPDKVIYRAIACSMLGRLYKQTNNYSRSVESFGEAARWFQMSHHREALAEALCEKGSVLVKLGKNKNAEALFAKSIDLLKDVPSNDQTASKIESFCQKCYSDLMKVSPAK